MNYDMNSTDSCRDICEFYFQYIRLDGMVRVKIRLHNDAALCYYGLRPFIAELNYFDPTCQEEQSFYVPSTKTAIRWCNNAGGRMSRIPVAV